MPLRAADRPRSRRGAAPAQQGSGLTDPDGAPSTHTSSNRSGGGAEMPGLELHLAPPGRDRYRD